MLYQSFHVCAALVGSFVSLSQVFRERRPVEIPPYSERLVTWSVGQSNCRPDSQVYVRNDVVQEDVCGFGNVCEINRQK